MGDLMERYCLYLRKSRADCEAEARGEAETLARHENILRELAEKLHLHIAAIYREVVSGETISARPVMQQLLSEVEKSMWNGVLVVEVERLARGDTIDQGIVSRAFQYSGTKIITPAKIYDPNNEFDEEYFEFGLFMSRREYKTIKRRLNAGRLSSAKEGKYVGSRPPYGYERIKLPHDKGFTLSPHPEQAPIVRMIYEWYVNGQKGERMGISRIVRQLNTLGIPALNKAAWSPATVSGILSNPVYIGKIAWNRRKTVKQITNGQVRITRPRTSEYLLFQGLHPPIVSNELWEKAQLIRSQNPSRPVNTLHTLRNPLAGLIVCGHCGRKMIRRPYSKNEQAAMLICPYTDCPTVSSRLDLVEQSILYILQELFQNYRTNPETGPTSSAPLIKSLEEIIQKHRNNLQTLNSQKSRQYELLEQGIYTMEVFLDRSETLAQQIASSASALSEAEKNLIVEKERLPNHQNQIPKSGQLLSDYWNWDIKTRNDVLKELLEKVVYTKQTKNKHGEGNTPAFKLQLYPKLP